MHNSLVFEKNNLSVADQIKNNLKNKIINSVLQKEILKIFNQKMIKN